MGAPRLEVHLGRLHHNARTLVERLGARGVAVTGVTKATLGSPEVAAALVAAAPPGDDDEEQTGERDPLSREPRDTDEDIGELDERQLSDEDRRRRDEITRLLREHKGNISAIARVMGKARMQIQRWCKRYRLDPESFRK